MQTGRWEDVSEGVVDYTRTVPHNQSQRVGHLHGGHHSMAGGVPLSQGDERPSALAYI